MDFPFVNLFNPSLNWIFMLFGLLSILCQLAGLGAGIILQSRSGGDRAHFAKGLLCHLAVGSS